jgi:hypothetical protein
VRTLPLKVSACSLISLSPAGRVLWSVLPGCLGKLAREPGYSGPDWDTLLFSSATEGESSRAVLVRAGFSCTGVAPGGAKYRPRVDSAMWHIPGDIVRSTVPPHMHVMTAEDWDPHPKKPFWFAIDIDFVQREIMETKETNALAMILQQVRGTQSFLRVIPGGAVHGVLSANMLGFVFGSHRMAEYAYVLLADRATGLRDGLGRFALGVQEFPDHRFS